MSKNEQYVVYLGVNIIEVYEKEEKAKEKYNSLPSGKGKRPSLRRSLVKEIVVIEDTRF